MIPFARERRYYNRCLAGPFVALPCRVDRSAMRADPTQAGVASITLCDCVGSDQTEAAVVPNQIEGAAIEMRDQIRIPVRFFVQRLEPIQVSVAI